MNRVERLRTKSFEKEDWQKLFYKYQQHYIRKRLEAIKYLHDGKTVREVMEQLNCARQSLITWIDMYCQGGSKALVTPLKSEREQRLGPEKKEELKKIILEKKPTDYGTDRQIWTGKIIIEVINQKWNVQIELQLAVLGRRLFKDGLYGVTQIIRVASLFTDAALQPSPAFLNPI